jgi:GTP pyrophosphokinase
VSLGEWKPFDGLKAEIQVRTIGQHAWAAISHALQYKREQDAPVNVQRRLARLAGLLELVDDESEALRAASQTEAGRVLQIFEGGNLNVPLDFSIVNAYLKNSPEVPSVDTQNRQLIDTSKPAIN